MGRINETVATFNSALRTMLELDGSTLWVTATHLTTRSPEERGEQVAALAALHTEGMAAGVLVGDFNARPDAAELDPLRVRFTDAWELAEDRDDQARWRFWQRDEGLTHPAHAPSRQSDSFAFFPSFVRTLPAGVHRLTLATLHI